MLRDFFANLFWNRNRYRQHSEACIVSCFFNPQNSPYRLLAFQKWYHSIKHLNHRIVECLIGPDAKSQLPESPYITQVRADSLLFHKEALLNLAIEDLPPEIKYVFWLDADVLFTNLNWLTDGVKQLQTANVIQPFEYCVHLEQNQIRPDFDLDPYRDTVNNPGRRHKQMWRSFCATYVIDAHEHTDHSSSINYDEHGHVGFAWGARREILQKVPLYEKALIGGADHVLAHAAVGQIPHDCINKSFTDNLADITEWSRAFAAACNRRVGYVTGDLYHIWHGNVSDRAYLKRIKEFTGSTRDLTRDKYGFYTAKGKNAAYMKKYYRQREVAYDDGYDFGGFDDGFYEDMGYTIYQIGQLFGQPSYYQDDPNAGVADPGNQPSPDTLPFSMGGAGVTDDGRHVITDEQLQGAVIGGDPNVNAAEAASRQLDEALSVGGVDAATRASQQLDEALSAGQGWTPGNSTAAEAAAASRQLDDALSAAKATEELETAIHHASQPDFEPAAGGGDDPAPKDVGDVSGNFS